MKKKQNVVSHPVKSQSLTIRLFTTVFIVLIILNVLAIIGALSLSSISREKILQDYSYVGQLYMDQLDRELEQAQIRMFNLSRSNTFNIAFSWSEDSQEQYAIYRRQSELNESLNEWISQFPVIDGYYLYQPEEGVLIAAGSNSAEVMYCTQWLEESVLNELEGGWRLTSFLKEDQKSTDNSILHFCARHLNIWYGAWVQPDRLLERWGLFSDAGDGKYRFMAGDQQEQRNCVDTLSTQADLLLRYQLPQEGMVLPSGVLILLIASVIMLLALPFVWQSLNRLVLSPLNELIDAIHRIEGGDTSFRIPEQSTSSEFGQLNMQFNSSIEQLTNMRIQVYETQLEKERIYVNYLSQQMQPHFVLNTLNLIFSMEPEEYDLIQKTVACLSDYYRYIAHVNEPLLPVFAELSHVENYFKLQQIRYPEMFFYSIICPEELQDWMIPPVLIQTFAENAIKYSLCVGEVNRVEILLETEQISENIHAEQAQLRKQKRLRIHIRDHGKGYPAEVLQLIDTFLTTGKHQEGLGLGIQNTVERLRLIYQNHADIRISNVPDGGAQIDLYIPEIPKLVAD